MVELALLIPLLVLIVFGAIDLARAYHAQVTITNASREGARFAMRINNSSDALYDTPGEKYSAIQQRVQDEAGASGVEIELPDVSVSCRLGDAPPCASGDGIIVRVEYEFNLLMGAYFLPSFDLNHEAEMVTP